MNDEKSDWIYCRLVDRGHFIFPRTPWWFGHFEFSSEREADASCLEALSSSMRAFAVSESNDGWKRLVRVRTVLRDDSLEGASHTGALYLKETVRLLNTYVAHLNPLRETDAGYLCDLRARTAVAIAPRPEARSSSGIFALIDETALHPGYTLSTLLVTAPDVHGELGLAFRRCAHWRDLAGAAEDESERLLLNWMAAECLAKLAADDTVAPRLLAAAGLPTGKLAKQLSPSEKAGILALPTARFWQRRLTVVLDKLRAARNMIVHSGYRHVDLETLLTQEERNLADEVLPIATRCLSEIALWALNLRIFTLREMWAAYPAVIGPGGVVHRASWFLSRLESL